MNGMTLAEIFQIAEHTEANAADFYRKAAKLQTNLHDAEKLNQMARMEENHQAFFEALARKKSADAGSLEDPYGDLRLYLRALADQHGGEGSQEMMKALSGSVRLDEILRVAVKGEIQSVLYYMGITEAVRDPKDRETLGAIIDEEMKHIVTLQGMLESEHKTL